MSESGWLIESTNTFPRHEWLRILANGTKSPFNGTKLIWTNDSDVALRFARKIDAEDFLKLHPDYAALTIVTEHHWGAASLGAQ